MVSFTERIHAIYDRHAPIHIHPFIGAAFETPAADDLRIMAMGINSYVDENHEGVAPPHWFADWFRTRKYRYQTSMGRSLDFLGNTITKMPFDLATKRYRGAESVYLTNAVKVYVPQREGKRADQISEGLYERHLGQWHDELDVMAESNVLPQVLAIVGRPFWSFACQAFRSPVPFASLRVRASHPCADECRDHVNALTLETPHGVHEMLLVRLRHPAARTKVGSVEWLLSQPDFLEIATRGDGSPSPEDSGKTQRREVAPAVTVALAAYADDTPRRVVPAFHGDYLALPLYLSLNELAYVGHAVNGNDIERDYLPDAFTIVGRLEKEYEATGQYRGTTPELLYALFVKVRSVRGMWELPTDGDEFHRAALAIYRALRARRASHPEEVVFTIATEREHDKA